VYQREGHDYITFYLCDQCGAVISFRGVADHFAAFNRRARVAKLERELSDAYMALDANSADLRAALAKREAVAVPEGIVSITRGFEYDYETRLHTPTVLVRFKPGKGESGELWKGRDALGDALHDAMLAASQQTINAQPCGPSISEQHAHATKLRASQQAKPDNETGDSES
jgi:hypothetical protein